MGNIISIVNHNPTAAIALWDRSTCAWKLTSWDPIMFFRRALFARQCVANSYIKGESNRWTTPITEEDVRAMNLILLGIKQEKRKHQVEQLCRNTKANKGDAVDVEERLRQLREEKKAAQEDISRTPTPRKLGPCLKPTPPTTQRRVRFTFDATSAASLTKIISFSTTAPEIIPPYQPKPTLLHPRPPLPPTLLHMLHNPIVHLVLSRGLSHLEASLSPSDLSTRHLTLANTIANRHGTSRAHGRANARFDAHTPHPRGCGPLMSETLTMPRERKVRIDEFVRCREFYGKDGAPRDLGRGWSVVVKKRDGPGRARRRS